MADLTSIVTTAVISQFTGPTAKYLGEQALERAKQVAGKAAALLRAVGREPQPVEPKLLLPLVQAAGLETDEVLADRWAALLANAADPAQVVTIQPGFVEVLRQLTPTDARALALLYEPAGESPTQPVVSGYMTKMLLGSFGLDYHQASLTVDNLLRLQLCHVVVEGGRGLSLLPGAVSGSTYGFYFMKAVSPPAT